MLTRVLTGSLGADPIAANIVSILACGALNFGASEWLVFRRAAAAAVIVLTVQPMFAAAPADDLGSVDLRAHTLQAWTGYEQRVDTRYEGAGATASPSSRSMPSARRTGDRPPWGGAWRCHESRPPARGRRTRHRGRQDSPLGRGHLRAGRLDGTPAQTARGSRRPRQQHYEDVVASRLLADNDRYRIYMKIRRSKIITVTYNTEHDVQAEDSARRASPPAARPRELRSSTTPARRRSAS